VDKGVDNALWIKAVDDGLLIPRLWMNLWTTWVWTNPVDDDEVINRLWIRLWITFEARDGGWASKSWYIEGAGLFSKASGIWGASPYNLYCTILI
jgi:hypothetical protein